MIKIKECPFCGASADIQTQSTDMRCYYDAVECDNCGAVGPIYKCEMDNNEGLIKAWNKRYESTV